MTEVTMEATTYTFCALPEGNVNFRHYCVTVEKRGPGSWAVMQGGFALGTDAVFDYEPPPGSRTDEWLRTHRFDLPTALRLAEQEAAVAEVNGISVDDVLDRAKRAAARPAEPTEASDAH